MLDDKTLIDSLANACKALNKHAVDYLIVGGTAVALHGYSRPTIPTSGQVEGKPDIDFWYSPTYGNYYKLLNAVEEFGQDVSVFKKEKTPDPRKSFFKFEFDRFTADFLPELPGLKRFRDAYNAKCVTQIEDVEISYICLNDLIINKQTLARPSDLKDIQELQSRHKEQ